MTGMKTSTPQPKRVAHPRIGKFLDRTYRLAVGRLLVDHSPETGVLPEILIAKIRLKGSYVLITISALGTLGYGLALMKRTVL
jgi:hypothetical protein